LQLTCELPAAVEIRPRDPKHLNSERGQRTVASAIRVEGTPRLMKRRSVDLHGEARLRPIEVDAIALDELGPRIGQAMPSA
jgi:hypothetical protein